MTKEKIKNEFLISIGSVIRKKRQKRNITQRELGEYLEVSKATISKYENGKMDMPATTLPLISSYCDFPLSDYIYDEKVKMATSNFEILIKNSQRDSDSETETLPTAEQLTIYENTINNIKAYLYNENVYEIVDILNSAGHIIGLTEKDDIELARQLSDYTITYICNRDSYIQACSRIARKCMEKN